VETRASYVAVGAFVLLLMAAMAAFVVWLAGSSLRNVSLDNYLLFFSGSVSGLQEGSGVNYRGVPVGSVQSILIDPQNLERIRVVIGVRAGTPIVQGSVASLEIQGLTGNAAVQITGGVAGAPALVTPPGEPYPVLPVEITGFQAIVESVPQVLQRTSALLTDLGALISPDNQRAVTEILINVNTLTEALADRAQGIGATVARIDKLADDVDLLVNEARGELARLGSGADTLVTTANSTIVRVSNNVDALLASLDSSATEIARILRDVAPGLETFGTDGLYEATALVGELRGLTENLSRLVTRVERSPGQFLFGGSGGGVPTERAR
jgi:phospholipid/cholesterol/gamma-HCH transport system substrate-binding protein